MSSQEGLGRRIVLAALLLGSAVAVTPAANAQSGFLCGFASITDPTVEGDVQTGEIDGGPLFAADVDNPGEETANISIRCTIQVGAQGETHAGTDAYSAEGPTNAGVAVLPAHQFTYVAPTGAPVYICTEARVNGQARYHAHDRGWSTDANVACALAISQEVDLSGLLPELPADAIVIIAPPDGSEPSHMNVDMDCRTYTWTPSTGVYEVTCVSIFGPRQCTAVTATAIGLPGGLSVSSSCNALVASTVAVGHAQAVGSDVTPWKCRIQGRGIGICTMT